MENFIEEFSRGIRYVGFDIDENTMNNIDTNLLQEGDVVIMDTNEMLLWDGMSWITIGSANNEWVVKEENIFIEEDENEAYLERIGV